MAEAHQNTAGGPSLRILHHDGSEEVKDLVDGDLTIGRGPDNWLCPIDPALSRQHAVIRSSAGRLIIEDLGTRNGTRVNGEKIDEAAPLRAGDVVELGATRLIVLAAQLAPDSRRLQPTVEIAGGGHPETMIAVSAVMRELTQKADKLARSGLPVLITGETGTGKELLAYRIHLKSNRRDGPLVILNCPALAPGVVESELFGVESGVATDVRARTGRLEEAAGGTLFLDEVADLDRGAQAKLLRFLQDGTIERVGGRRTEKVDVRLVAATNQDLDQARSEGRLRDDLYFRIAAARLDVPPLRERRDDIRPLIDHLLARRNLGHVRLDDRAIQALEDYEFPGNVRELDAIVSRAAVLAEEGAVHVEDLALGAAAPEAAGSSLWNAEEVLASITNGECTFWDAVYRPFMDRELTRSRVRSLIAKGLERADGSVKDLAALLGESDNYRRLLDFLRNNRLLP